MKLLTPEDQHREQVTNLANVFTRVDRVLSGRGDVVCKAEFSGSNAPAWSDGKTITFNISKIDSITSVEDIVMMTGLNYHELAHVLFTVRENHEVGQFVLTGGYQNAYNILEDQRIETLLTAQYPATAAYFTTTFMRYCLAREEQWESNHVLAYGRRYLPRKVRKAFSERFEWQEHRKEFEYVIDAYRLLNPHKKTHAKKMKTLIRRFDGLLDMINPPSQPYGHGHGRPEQPQRGKEATAAQQDEAAEWAEWYDDDREAEEAEQDEQERTEKGRDSKSKEEDSDEEGEDGAGGDDSGDASEEDESGEDGAGGSDGEDDGSEDGDASDGDSGDGADASDGVDDDDDQPGSRGDGDNDGSDDVGEGDDPFGQGDGTGKGDGTKADGQRHFDDKHELRGIIEEEMNGVLNDAEVQREAIAKQNQIINGTGQALPQLSTKRASYKKPSAQMINLTAKFGKEIERLRDDLDPGWHRHKSSGRINVQRAIQGADLDTVWDQWDEGVNDSTDFEAVLYIDYSGSMSGSEMDRACEAAWIIKRAIERVKGTVTVYAFDDQSSILYRPDQKAEANEVKIISADGFTDPTEAIRDSLRIFQQSKRRNKLAIFLTDGGWSGERMGNPDAWPDMIQRMNAFGIVTALAVIGGHGGTYDTPKSRRYTQIAQDIDHAGDLVGFAKVLVKQVMKGNRQ